MTGETEKYLGPQDLRELGDDSLPQEGYVGFSIGARSSSPKVRDSMMIEEILAPTKDTGIYKAMPFVVEPPNKHLAKAREHDADSLRRYSWAADTLDNVNLVSSPIHSGFLVSFMVDARGGSMRGSRHNGMRIIIPPRKCTAPTRITCRLVKRSKLASPPPMVEGEGLAGRLVEMGPAGAHFLGPVIVEIPHFGSMRGKERELIILRSENGEAWKEHQYDCKTEALNELLNGMDEELDSLDELEKKRVCRIITKDFPQYFAVVSRIKQESNYMGPEGGLLSCSTISLVQASFPEGALTKKIRVGLQAQPVPDETVKKILGNRATFSPIVTVEPRRRKFHKPITMTIPVPPLSGEGVTNGYKGDSTPCLRLLCSITGGTSPAQWEDITGTTPLTFNSDCVSFTTNVSARFWLADCHQIPETVGLATQLYRELICVPYMAKFVVFAKMNDPVESNLRCFCMTDDKVDKTLEQQENFEEVARSKDIEVLEGKPIYVDCYGNLTPLIKAGQQLVLNFYAFKENRLPFCVKIRDNSQEPCGRLSFLREMKTSKGLPQTAVCNLNITLPALKKTAKPERRHTFSSLALRPQSPCERTDLRMAIVADHLGLSWTELAREMDFSVDEINYIRVENPNSLTAQSFMLLKKWVSRDGKNATTDALTTALTKINRMDIVTLLEGPIFDYGYHNIELELQSPTELSYEPPTPLRHDDFFSEDSSIVSPTTAPVRPSELALPTTSMDAQPPTVVPEDTSLGGRGSCSRKSGLIEDDLHISHELTASLEACDSEEEFGVPEVFTKHLLRVQDPHQASAVQPDAPPSGGLGPKESSGSGFAEEEMSQEKLKSLLGDNKLEEGSEDEEMTEVQMILSQVEQAEKDMSSIAGWQGEVSDVNRETWTSGQGLCTDMQVPKESSQQPASSGPELQAETRNGEHPAPQSHAGILPEAEGPAAKVKCKVLKDSARNELSGDITEDSTEEEDSTQPKVEGVHRDSGSSSDEEHTVTTRVYRRRVILKGDQAKNIPGESVTKEQFTDEDGNVVTRKVIRKVVRRVAGTGEKCRKTRGICSQLEPAKDVKGPPGGLKHPTEHPEATQGAKGKKKDARPGESKGQS